jgi:hypothetical protein
MPTESTMLYERSRPLNTNRNNVGLTAFKAGPPTHRCFAHDEPPAEPLEVRS